MKFSRTAGTVLFIALHNSHMPIKCSEALPFLWNILVEVISHLPLEMCQWCSRDRKTETWLKFRDETETSSKTSRPTLETWSPRPRLETSKFVHFAELKKMLSSLLTWNFFKFLAFFCFGCFWPANTTNKNSWIIEILIHHFFAILKVSKPETFETETRKNGSRHRDPVSRLHHWNVHLYTFLSSWSYRL